MIELIIDNKIDYIFSLSSRSNFSFNKGKLNKAKWVTIQHWGDNFTSEREKVLDCDILCLYSRKWWNGFVNSSYGRELKTMEQEISAPQIILSGCPYHDQTYNFDYKDIKNKYGIPPKQKFFYICH